jgi:competence protein ComEA
LALVLAAVVLLSRQNGVAPIRIVAPPPSTQVALPPVPQEIRVYVSGAVVNPGVYSLGPDDRIADAIAAAGGETNDAESTGLNLAARVRDEARYHVPKAGEEPPPPQARSQGGVQPEGARGIAQAGGGPIDLNLASTGLLETLPGIGPALASAIVDYREGNGPFRSVDEIVDVPRIGPATLNNIRDLVTVSGSR